jgi:hypothetical protein
MVAADMSARRDGAVNPLRAPGGARESSSRGGAGALGLEASARIGVPVVGRFAYDAGGREECENCAVTTKSQRFCDCDRGKRALAREHKNVIAAKKLTDKRVISSSSLLRIWRNCSTCLTLRHRWRAGRGNVFGIELCRVINRLWRAAVALSSRLAARGEGRVGLSPRSELICPRRRAILARQA